MISENALISVVIDFQDPSFKFWYIALHFIILYFVVEFCIRFFARSANTDNDKVKKLNFAIGIASIFLFAIFFLQIVYHYFYSDIPRFNQILYGIFGTMMFACILIVEKSYISKRIFTYIALIAALACIFIPPDTIYIWIAYGLTAVIVSLPIWVFFQLYRTTGKKTRHKLIALCVSVGIFYIGCVLNLETIIPYIPNATFTLIGGVFIVVGLSGIYLTLSGIDIFIEADWRKYLIEVFIIVKKNLNLIYHKIFTENLNTIEIDETIPSKDPESQNKSFKMEHLEKTKIVNGAETESQRISKLDSEIGMPEKIEDRTKQWGQIIDKGTPLEDGWVDVSDVIKSIPDKETRALPKQRKNLHPEYQDLKKDIKKDIKRAKKLREKREKIEQWKEKHQGEQLQMFSGGIVGIESIIKNVSQSNSLE
ncbi:MAG: hypothetical protein GF364_19860, partial [Candidatus Lokiarchaeota archaeon]|nr:hypothetical protein [Candidatus Lokiarchaeota archaeon]